MVITTPMIVYRHGDDVPGERIREILVYEDCISQPDWNVENPDNSDLPTTQSACAAQIELTHAGGSGAAKGENGNNQDRLSRLFAPDKNSLEGQARLI
jgi:hypothetical protein